VHSSSPIETASSRDRFVLVGCIVLITAIAWAYLLHLDHQMSAAATSDRMMAEMGMSTDVSWTLADVFFTFIMWTVMMVGMMSPSAAPVFLLFAATRGRRDNIRMSFAVVLFAVAYITVWAGFSALAALGQWGLHEALMLSPSMAASSPALGGAILLGAGIYQLSWFKGTCLTHCRSPLGFLLSHWRGGALGAFQMGLRHGAYCVGCCWALMCMLFVVGVMNLAWVAALGIFVLLEKVAPIGSRLARVAGAVLILGGILRIWGAVYG
jgi:predicted metal-binding membrane protein